MPDIATLNGVDENNIATHNGATASTYASHNGGTWVHFTAMAATGGSVTTDGDYKVHTFNSGATFTVTTLGHAEIEYLVLAGGGGGSTNAGGGGYYREDGKFVSANGQVSATGSISSGIQYILSLENSGLILPENLKKRLLKGINTQAMDWQQENALAEKFGYAKN